MVFNITSHTASAQTIPTQAATPARAECHVKDTEIQGRYVGQCDPMGWAHGLGTANGKLAMYTGEFNHGEKQGYGTKTWINNGDKYVGQFNHEFKEGVGIYVWGEQSSLKGYQYIGQFKQDKRHGQGIFDWGNGESYAGQWAEDAQTTGLTPSQILQMQATQAKNWQAPK